MKMICYLHIYNTNLIIFLIMKLQNEPKHLKKKKAMEKKCHSKRVSKTDLLEGNIFLI